MIVSEDSSLGEAITNLRPGLRTFGGGGTINAAPPYTIIVSAGLNTQGAAGGGYDNGWRHAASSMTRSGERGLGLDRAAGAAVAAAARTAPKAMGARIGWASTCGVLYRVLADQLDVTVLGMAIAASTTP